MEKEINHTPASTQMNSSLLQIRKSWFSLTFFLCGYVSTNSADFWIWPQRRKVTKTEQSIYWLALEKVCPGKSKETLIMHLILSDS